MLVKRYTSLLLNQSADFSENLSKRCSSYTERFFCTEPRLIFNISSTRFSYLTCTAISVDICTVHAKNFQKPPAQLSNAVHQLTMTFNIMVTKFQAVPTPPWSAGPLSVGTRTDVTERSGLKSLSHSPLLQFANLERCQFSFIQSVRFTQ